MSNYSQYALIYVTRPVKIDQFGMKDISEIITQYIGGGSFYEVGGLATDDQLLMHA